MLLDPDAMHAAAIDLRVDTRGRGFDAVLVAGANSTVETPNRGARGHLVETGQLG